MGSSDQIVDLEIIDGSHAGSKYLTKKDIKGETRMAITTHESADVGVCITNRLSPCKSVFLIPPFLISSLFHAH
jgi:hypothetical protein